MESSKYQTRVSCHHNPGSVRSKNCVTSANAIPLSTTISNDKPFWLIIGILCFSMLILCLHATLHFGWQPYFFRWMEYIPLLSLVILFQWFDTKVPFSLSVPIILTKFLVGFALAYTVTPVLLTTTHPFRDVYLLHADQWLHFNSLTLINFTEAHPVFHSMMNFFYTHLQQSFVILILIFSLMQREDITNKLLVFSLIALFVAALSFYFFPAFGPSLVIKSANFPAYGPIELSQYYLVQHGGALDMKNYFAGFVSMPSIHVFIASLAIYSCFAVKELRIYLWPLAIFNIGIILSTLFLGEHYFVDLIGAWVLLAVLLLVVKWLARRSCSDSTRSLCLAPKNLLV